MTEHGNTASAAMSSPGPLPDEQLPPYSGEATVCVKCGHIGANTRYLAAGERGTLESKPRRPSPKGERLERECMRCGYAWDEALASPPVVEGAGVRERCPDHPTRYRKGCLDCAIAVPGEPPAAGTSQQPRHSSHTGAGAPREPAGDPRGTEAPEWPSGARTRDLAVRQDLESHQVEQLDNAYRERAHLLALLAAMTPDAVIAPAPDVDEPGWQIAYLTFGSRQCSWHISPRDADLFAHVEHVRVDDPRAQWDGHTTDEKYAHIAAHTVELMHSCGPECAEMHTETGRCGIARNR